VEGEATVSRLELDDQILNHPKFIRAVKIGGSEPIHMWLGIRAYVGQNLSDGFVPADMVDEVRGPLGKKRTAALKVLTDVGLLHHVACGRISLPVCDRCDSMVAAVVPVGGAGYLMHDFLQWSSSKEQVLQWRASNNQRNALRSNVDLMSAIKARDGSRCRYCGIAVNWADKRSALGGTYDHVQPLSRGGQNDPINVVVCCRGCNSRKGNRLLSECGIQLIPIGTTGKLPVEETQKDLVSSPTTTPPSSATTPKPPVVVAGKIRCPADLELTEAQRGQLMHIPPWAIEELTRKFRSQWVDSTDGDRTLDQWRRSLTSAISGTWNDSSRRPKEPKTEPEDKKAANGEDGPRWL
jgi:5-methylcytosine-specific restriction endonuclease McrA